MSLNIGALVTGAFGIAKGLVPDALPACTLRVNPTAVNNPMTGQSTVTWAIEKTNLNPVAYGSKQEREAKPEEMNLRSFAFDRAAIGEPVAALLDQAAEITQSGSTWNVYRVETDPTGSLVIFHANR